MWLFWKCKKLNSASKGRGTKLNESICYCWLNSQDSKPRVRWKSGIAKPSLVCQQKSLDCGFKYQMFKYQVIRYQDIKYQRDLGQIFSRSLNYSNISKVNLKVREVQFVGLLNRLSDHFKGNWDNISDILMDLQ